MCPYWGPGDQHWIFLVPVIYFFMNCLKIPQKFR